MDSNPSMTDITIWTYALKNKYMNLTKDADFYERTLISKNKPKVIYFQVGNQTLKELHGYFEKYWNSIRTLFDSSSLIIAKHSGLSIVM